MQYIIARAFAKTLTKYTLILALLASTVFALAPVVLAASSPQPVEWENYQSGAVRLSLGNYWLQNDCKQAGRWWDFDWKVRINTNASYNPDALRIFSNDNRVQQVFNGKAPMGVDLLGVSPAICIGLGDATNAGGIANVRNQMFVWVRR